MIAKNFISVQCATTPMQHVYLKRMLVIAEIFVKLLCLGSK